MFNNTHIEYDNKIYVVSDSKIIIYDEFFNVIKCIDPDASIIRGAFDKKYGKFQIAIYKNLVYIKNKNKLKIYNLFGKYLGFTYIFTYVSHFEINNNIIKLCEKYDDEHIYIKTHDIENITLESVCKYEHEKYIKCVNDFKKPEKNNDIKYATHKLNITTRHNAYVYEICNRDIIKFNSDMSRMIKKFNFKNHLKVDIYFISLLKIHNKHVYALSNKNTISKWSLNGRYYKKYKTLLSDSCYDFIVLDSGIYIFNESTENHADDQKIKFIPFKINNETCKLLKGKYRILFDIIPKICYVPKEIQIKIFNYMLQ